MLSLLVLAFGLICQRFQPGGNITHYCVEQPWWSGVTSSLLAHPDINRLRGSCREQRICGSPEQWTRIDANTIKKILLQ